MFDSSFNFLFFILLLIGAGIAGYFAWKKERERREALKKIAIELGWSYSPAHDRHHDDQYSHFEIFRRGHSRVAYNTLRGTLPIFGISAAAQIGDFRYKVTRGSGKSRHTSTYHFSYLIVHMPHRTIPDLVIRPEHMFDRLAGVFGFDDIDFESAAFSKHFFVKSRDERFAYDVVDPRMMEFLLESRPPTVDIEIGRCCISDGQTRWSPDEFLNQIEWANRFFQQWPAHVVNRLGDSMSRHV